MLGLFVGVTLVAGGWAGLAEVVSVPASTLAVLIGLVLTVASCVGFYLIKPLEYENTVPERSPAGVTPREARAK